MLFWVHEQMSSKSCFGWDIGILMLGAQTPLVHPERVMSPLDPPPRTARYMGLDLIHWRSKSLGHASLQVTCVDDSARASGANQQ